MVRYNHGKQSIIAVEPYMLIVVADDLPKSALELLRAEGWTIDSKSGRSPEELSRDLAEADALVVRSATKVTAEIIAAGTKLRAIARAGSSAAPSVSPNPAAWRAISDKCSRAALQSASGASTRASWSAASAISISASGTRPMASSASRGSDEGMRHCAAVGRGAATGFKTGAAGPATQPA